MTTVLRGWLEKRSDWTRTWQKRYFVLAGDELQYFVSRTDANPKGTIKVCKAQARTSLAKGDCAFQLSAEGKSYILACETAKDTTMWIDGLNRVGLAISNESKLEIIKAVFEEGSLGMRLAADTRIDSAGCAVIKAIKEGSLATKSSLKVGDTLLSVNNVNVSFGHCSFKDALKNIQESERPMTLTFGRKTPVRRVKMEDVGGISDGDVALAPSDTSYVSIKDLCVTPRKARLSVRSDRSDRSASSVLSELKVASPSKMMDLDVRPSITPAMHTAWRDAIKSYRPRVEVTDPEAVTAKRASIGGKSTHVEYRVVVTMLDKISDETCAKITGGGIDASAIQKRVTSVKRRYSDFLWLRNALLSRYSGLYVPPVPLKRHRLGSSLTLFNDLKASKRDFIVERMGMLKFFLEAVVRNPYLRIDAAVRAFVSVQGREQFEESKAAIGVKISSESMLKHWSRFMWITHVESNMGKITSDSARVETESDRNVTEAVAQVEKLLKALQVVLKTTEKVGAKLDAVSDRSNDMNAALSAWFQVEDKGADASSNEYLLPKGREIKGATKGLGHTIQVSTKKSQSASVEFRSIVLTRVKYLSLEFKVMQTLLAKRQEVANRVDSLRQKAEKLSKNAAFDDAKRAAREKTLVELQEDEYTSRFFDSALLTFTIGRFRVHLKKAILELFAQLSSSQLRHAKDGEMMSKLLFGQSGADRAKMLSRAHCSLNTSGEKLPKVLRGALGRIQKGV